MIVRCAWRFRCRFGTAAIFAVLLLASSGFAANAQVFDQTNLTSDIPGLAHNTDPNLKNPWGDSFGPTTPVWISDQVTGKATLYNGNGVPQALVVTIPGGNPTGQVFNSTADFVLPVGGKALFMFSSLGGTISGWNGGSGTTAQTVVTSPGSVYTGLSLGSAGPGSVLFAANAALGRIDVFNGTFAPTTLAGSFVDPSLPAGFAPYNVRNIGGTVYVTYDDRGAGGGVVDAFDINGNFLRRISSNAVGGPLSDPWGLVIAPSSFGQFGNDLLVGNEGDGHISAFNPVTGQFLGQLDNASGNPVANPGLWGLDFGNGGVGSDPSLLYFAAGINGQRDGLFGSIRAVPEPGPVAMLASLCVTGGLFALRRIRGRKK